MNKILPTNSPNFGCRHGARRMRQQGAVLVVSLLILLIMTIIGVTTMQTTSLEEKMAGNLLEQRLAFQTAETALRVAEGQLDALVYYPTGTGYYTLADDDPYDEGDGWDTMSVLNLSGDGVNAEYYVKNLGEFAPDTTAKVSIGGYGESIAGSSVTVLTITARGTGRSDGSGGAGVPAQIFLRSYYGKRF